MSEAFILATCPFSEGDLIVSFLTRDLGKLRGVARRAQASEEWFWFRLGAAFAHKNVLFPARNRELVNIDSCELLQSQFALLRRFPRRLRARFLRRSLRTTAAAPPNPTKNTSAS